MKAGVIGLAAGLLAGMAVAEVREVHAEIGPEKLWIEVVGGTEVMWIGTSEAARTKVLAGVDIEIVARLTEPDSVALVGARALVVEVPASHTCEDLTEALSYYVITLGDVPVAEGPLTTCGGKEVGFLPGRISLEGDPETMDAFWEWRPGQGFMAWGQ